MKNCAGAGIRWGMVLFKIPLLCYTIANIYFVLPQIAVAARAWLELLLLGNLIVAYGAGWCMDMFLPRGRECDMRTVGKWLLPAAVVLGVITAHIDALSLVLLPLPVPEGLPSGAVAVPGAAAISLHGAVAGLFAGYIFLAATCRPTSLSHNSPTDHYDIVVGRWMGIGCVLLAILPVLAYIAFSLEDHVTNPFTPVIILLTIAIMVINYVLAASVGRALARTAEPHLVMYSEISLRCMSAGYAIGGGWFIALLDNIIVFTLNYDYTLPPLSRISLLSLIGGAAGISMIEAIPGGLFIGTVVVTLLLERRNRLRHEMTLRNTAPPSVT